MIMFREISEHRFNFIDGHSNGSSQSNKDCKAYAITDNRGLLIAFQEFDFALNKVHFYERILQNV